MVISLGVSLTNNKPELQQPAADGLRFAPPLAPHYRWKHRDMKNEMKSKKNPFLAFAMLSILAPTTARADGGVPMLALLWPASWIALIPIVIIEAWIARRIIGLAWKPALIRSSIANAVSTFIGIPLAWGALLIAQIGLTGGRRTFGMYTLPQKLFVAIIQAPWPKPYREDIYGHLDWLIPSAAIVLLIPLFFASVYLERWAFDRKKQLEKGLVRSWSWKANLMTYGIMLFFLLFTLIYNITNIVGGTTSR